MFEKLFKRSTEERTARKLLVKAGVLQMVEKETDGEVVIILDDDDKKECGTLLEINEEIQSLTAECNRLIAEINGKSLHLHGLKTLWWETLKSKYPEVDKASKTCGIHMDTKYMRVRKGVFK